MTPLPWRPAPKRRGALWRVIPLAVWIAAIVLFGGQLMASSATYAGVLGCVAAFWLGARLASSRVRLWVLWLLALPAQGLVVLTASALRRADFTAQLVGPENAYVFSALVLYFGSCTLWIGLFQASSRRIPPFVALEVAAIAAIGAAIFAQHREGFINRPYFLVDPLSARGYDPLPVFLAIGGAVAAVAILFLASNSAARKRKTTVLDVSILMVLTLLLYAVFPSGQIKNLHDLVSSGGPSEKERDRPTSAPRVDQGQQEKGNTTATPFPSGSEDGGPTPTPGDKDKTRERLKESAELLDDDFSKKKTGARSNEPVAVVLLHDDYTPPDGYYYFRQAVFSEFNGLRVVRDEGGHDRDVSEQFPNGTETVPVEHPNGNIAHPLETTVALIRSHTHPFGLVNPDALEAMNNPDPTHFQRAYKVESEVLSISLEGLLRYKVGSSKWNKETWDHYLAAPKDARYAELSKKCLVILRPPLRDEPLARAISVKLWLEQNGTYDITNKYEHSADPVGDFLFGDRVGYCVSFAHAAVALYRTVGVPARVGTGYAVDARFRGRGSSLLVRAGSAHAWPEIHLDGVGWIVLDIAPARSLVKPADPPDPGQQDLYGDLARKTSTQKPDQRPPAHGDVQQYVRDLLRHLAWGLIYGLVLLFVGMYAVKILRRLSPHWTDSSGLPLIAYRSLLDVMADHGRVRHFGQSREGFAREQATICPTLEVLTRVHLRCTLGRKGPPSPNTGDAGPPPSETPPTRDELLRLYARGCAEISAHTPLGGRVLAIFNPFGWWLVK